MRELFGLEGKRILIVGGGQGMGEATARLLASLGADLAILDLEQGRAERVCAEVGQAGITAVPIVADVLEEASLVSGIAQAERDLGPLDGMATIIGMAGWSSIVDMTAETWDHDHNRNLRYFFFAAREVAKSLLARGASGSIVGVASVDGLRSAPFHASYGAAKAGLMNLARSMASEWSGRGIRVNIVAPGPIITPRVPFSGTENEMRSLSQVPMRRRGTVDEIARAITFFLSDMSTYVTGQTLAVDGGYLGESGFGHTATNLSVPTGGTMGIDNKA